MAPESSRWKVLVTARLAGDVGKAALDLLRQAGCELIIPPQCGPYPADQLEPLLAGVDAVLASMDKFNRAVLGSSGTGRLKVISRWGVGYDAIDIAAATEHGIVVAYTPGVLNEAVADFAFGLLLCVARRIHLGHLAMNQGRWQPFWGHDIHGKVLGIIGCGRIGQAMARRAAGFQMRLLGYDIAPNAEAELTGIRFVALDELLSESDFVSLHAALTPQNRGLISAAQLRLMKPTAYLINTARGALIDESALAQALREQRIAGAALDAFAVEPLPADNPFRDLPNVLLTPHLASFAHETADRVSLTAAQSIINLMNGSRTPLVVNPEVYGSPALRLVLESEP